jgi:hypothetical protein
MKLFGQPPRDPARIDEILADLGKIWKKYPDFRFYQLLNLFEMEYAKRDKFYVEDSDLQIGIDKFKKLRGIN